jgi:hypothetical protein
MELYELGIGLPVLSIAALMELLDDNIEPHRQADRARLARQARRHWSGPAPGPGVSSRAGALGAASGPRSTPRRRSCGSGTGSGGVDLGDHLLPHYRRGAAGAGRRPQGPSVRPSRRASYAIGALCSSGTAIPLVGVALLAN